MKRAFTFIELIITIAVVSTFFLIAMTTFIKVNDMAKKSVCISSLRQIGISLEAYISENKGNLPPYATHHGDGSKTWYFGHEPKNKNSEGDRELDKEKGALAPYIEPNTVEICPAFDYSDSIYKPKFRGSSWAYGYNWRLGGRFLGRPVKNVLDFRNPARVIVFADCAQINTFQAPASASNPMIEEFYILDPMFNTFHFRHDERANVLFLDGHVESLSSFSANSSIDNIGGKSNGEKSILKSEPSDVDTADSSNDSSPKSRIEELNIGNINWAEYPDSLR